MPRRWKHLVCLILLALVAQGCASASRPGGDANAPAPDTTAARVEDFLARATTGQSAQLPPADDGGAIHVEVQDEYFAASGRRCRQLELTNGVGPSAARVACRDEQGSWRLLPRLRNRELPGVSAAR